MDANTGAATPAPEQSPTSPSETTSRGPGILANREAQDARAAEERRKTIEEAAEVSARAAEVLKAEGAKASPLVPMSLYDPAEQAENNKFYRNLEILKLAVAHSPNPADAVTLAATYKKWMDEQ